MKHMRSLTLLCCSLLCACSSTDLGKLYAADPDTGSDPVIETSVETLAPIDTALAPETAAVDSTIVDSTIEPPDTTPDVLPIDTAVADTGTIAVDTAPDAAPDLGPCGKVCPAGGRCYGGLCEGPSCGTTGLACAGIGTSCCEAKLIPGGMFGLGRSTSGPEAEVCTTWAAGGYCCAPEAPERTATVSSFRLDTFEITVGRYRKFATAVTDGWKPKAGDGAHPLIAGSGWRSDWSMQLSVRTPKCAGADAGKETWTDEFGGNENKPMNCVDWYTFLAFCAWDGGRLPTEAEWEYAASGGENRPVPWTLGTAEPTCAFANLDGCTPKGFWNVGTVPAGAGKWGQQDLAGNITEWVLDESGTYSSTCVDCANVDFLPTAYRMVRGGGYGSISPFLRAASRGYADVPNDRAAGLGARCARGI